MIGRVAERDLAKEFLPKITIDELNANVKSFGSADNRAIAVSDSRWPAVGHDAIACSRS